MDEKEIEKAFRAILKEEKAKRGWVRFTLSPKMLAFFCYSLPLLLMISAQNYYSGGLFWTLAFSAMVGTGCFYSLRHYLAMKSLLTTDDKPLHQVIKEIREQEELDAKFAGTPLPNPKEINWDDMFENMEKAMADPTDDSDMMNVETLLDRGDTVENTPVRGGMAGFIRRIFRRN